MTIFTTIIAVLLTCATPDATDVARVLVDIDPVRPKGISSTAEELKRAADRAQV